jgi:hypothetical protein
VEDGRLTRVDEREMLARAREAAAEEMPYLEGGDGAAKLEALVEGMHRRAESQRLDVDAYIPA